VAHIPRHKTVAVAQLVAVVVFSLLCLSSAWFQIQAKGTYVEGIEREPTLWSNYTMGSESEHLQVEITNATPFIVYMSERDIVSESDADETSLEDGGFSLDEARGVVRAGVALTVITFAAILYRPRFLWMGMGFWAFTAFALLVIVPMSLLGGYASVEEPEPSGGLETGDEAGEGQFAHSELESDLSLKIIGVEWSFDSSGYDLGLVAEEHREAVATTPPEEGEPGHDAFIRFVGEVVISAGNGMVAWLLIPVVALLVNYGGRTGSSRSEQASGTEDDGAAEPSD